VKFICIAFGRIQTFDDFRYELASLVPCSKVLYRFLFPCLFIFVVADFGGGGWRGDGDRDGGVVSGSASSRENGESMFYFWFE